MQVNAVAGVLYQSNKILIAERPEGKSYAGFWEFPGGKIEENETAELALKRELAEEIGITLLSATYLFTHESVYPDYQLILQLWRIDTFEGTPTPNENQSIKWVHLCEIKNYNLLENNRLFFDRLSLNLC